MVAAGYKPHPHARCFKPRSVRPDIVQYERREIVVCVCRKRYNLKADCQKVDRVGKTTELDCRPPNAGVGIIAAQNMWLTGILLFLLAQYYNSQPKILAI